MDVGEELVRDRGPRPLDVDLGTVGLALPRRLCGIMTHVFTPVRCLCLPAPAATHSTARPICRAVFLSSSTARRGRARHRQSASDAGCRLRWRTLGGAMVGGAIGLVSPTPPARTCSA